MLPQKCQNSWRASAPTKTTAFSERHYPKARKDGDSTWMWMDQIMGNGGNNEGFDIVWMFGNCQTMVVRCG